MYLCIKANFFSLDKLLGAVSVFLEILSFYYNFFMYTFHGDCLVLRASLCFSDTKKTLFNSLVLNQEFKIRYWRMLSFMYTFNNDSVLLHKSLCYSEIRKTLFNNLI